MHVRIGRVLELARIEPAVRLGEFDRLAHDPDGALLGRGEDHLGAEEAHEPPTLHAEAVGHHRHQRIALRRANHGQADAGIAAGRLDHRLAGLQLARFLCRLDDAERQAVLDRAERIECLDLDVEVDPRRREPVDPHDRRVADRFENALISVAHLSLPCWLTSNVSRRPKSRPVGARQDQNRQMRAIQGKPGSRCKSRKCTGPESKEVAPLASQAGEARRQVARQGRYVGLTIIQDRCIKIEHHRLGLRGLRGKSFPSRRPSWQHLLWILSASPARDSGGAAIHAP